MLLCWLLPGYENADIICLCDNATQPGTWMDYHGPTSVLFSSDLCGGMLLHLDQCTTE